jgi:hypothetical protein
MTGLLSEEEEDEEDDEGDVAPPHPDIATAQEAKTHAKTGANLENGKAEADNLGIVPGGESFIAVLLVYRVGFRV